MAASEFTGNPPCPQRAAMIVCVCHGVSDRAIVAEVQGGCRSFEELQQRTHVSTCCGCCEDCARQVMAAATIVADARASSSAAVTTPTDAHPVRWHPALTA